MKTEEQLMAAEQSIEPARWQETFEVLMGRIAGRFARVEPRRHARELVLGLLAGLPRKNCWTLAEHAGHSTPDSLQHVLARAKWDADSVRDDLRGFVVDDLGTDDVVLVVDETGDLKKGTHTVGVQRQYAGTAGRIENSQVAVFLTYSTPRGHTAMDLELYVPRSWTEDPDRCHAAGIPGTLTFATKPQLAIRMIERALDAGTPAAWATGDEVYGDNTHLRDAPGEAGAELRPRCLLPSSHHHAGRKDPRRRPGQEDPETGLAEAVRRHRSQGPPPLRMGPGRHCRQPARSPAPPRPPQPPHRRNRLLSLLLDHADPAAVPGENGWTAVDGGRDLPVLQGPGRTGRTPGPALDVMASLGHPRDTRACFSRCDHRTRTQLAQALRRSDPNDPQRDPAPVHLARHPAASHRLAPPSLVAVATASPSQSPGSPLPTAARSGHPTSVEINIYGWTAKRTVC
ncbi:IS701 family transposase [Streptomyces sp. NPDC023723]|uniref:IS701 family transposase n=1 Tax=Streptomyces sp. NPDC023723 TaxID=3154323 RepID=UPI0033D03E70